MSVLEELFGVAGKSVLVTGGSRGIGRAMAEAFVRAGARVYVRSRDAESCNETARELSAFGACTALPCNMASDAERKRMAGDFTKHEKSFNVPVNNAGAIWASHQAQEVASPAPSRAKVQGKARTARAVKQFALRGTGEHRNNITRLTERRNARCLSTTSNTGDWKN